MSPISPGHKTRFASIAAPNFVEENFLFSREPEIGVRHTDNNVCLTYETIYTELSIIIIY